MSKSVPVSKTAEYVQIGLINCRTDGEGLCLSLLSGNKIYSNIPSSTESSIPLTSMN